MKICPSLEMRTFDPSQWGQQRLATSPAYFMWNDQIGESYTEKHWKKI